MFILGNVGEFLGYIVNLTLINEWVDHSRQIKIYNSPSPLYYFWPGECYISSSLSFTDKAPQIQVVIILVSFHKVML